MGSKFIAITMGDPAGIGPEISLKAIVEKEFIDCTVIYGSYEVLEHYRKMLKIDIPLVCIDSVEEFQNGKINVVSVLDLSMTDFEVGRVSAVCGDASYKYVAKAIGDAIRGDFKIVTTAPLNKEALHKGGHNFDGHTEIFATLTETKKYTMLLWSDKFAVVHVSTHCSLRDACDRAKKERILECIYLAQKAMNDLGVKNPKIAVAGLNPHSGEGGIFGREELDEIIPAIEEAVINGVNAVGPVSPDTVYLKASQGVYDIVVAMYHDQGHIPMKMLAFDSGVNVTLGLPIIRTSVDHGTAFDIAGKNIASMESMCCALRLGKRFLVN